MDRRGRVSLYKRVRERDGVIYIQEEQGIPYLHSLFPKERGMTFCSWIILVQEGLLRDKNKNANGFYSEYHYTTALKQI